MCCGQVNPAKRPTFPDVVDRLDALLAEYPESPKLEQRSGHDDSTDGVPERKTSYTSQVEIRLQDPGSAVDWKESNDAGNSCGMDSELKTFPESERLEVVGGTTRRTTSLRIDQRSRRSITADGSRGSMRRMSATSKLQPVNEQKASPEKHVGRSSFCT